MKSNQTLGVLLFIRKEKSSSTSKAPIYLRITVDHKPIEISLKREIEISNWVPSVGRAKGNAQKICQLNDYLNFWEGRVYAAQKELIENTSVLLQVP